MEFVEKRLYLFLKIKKMTIYSVYDQIAELLSGLDPAKVVALKPTEEIQKRFETLVEKKHNQTLDEMEKDELDHFVVLERLMRLAKIRAQNRLAA
jgi:hypothetical protein